MWFGTGGLSPGGGVSLYDGKSWITYTEKDGLAGNLVWSILQDREGVMWFGTSGGVSRYDGKSWITYTQKDGLANNAVNAILQDKEGVMWFGTRGGGVSRYDGKSWITYTQKDGLAGNWVEAVIQDKEGAMWFGTWGGGVSRYDGKSWITYTQKDGLVNNVVRSIIQDEEGGIWFGMDSDGVSRYDGKSWITYTQKDGLAHNEVKTIIQDKEGVMWFGTMGGVSRFDGESWITYTQKDGLAHSWVWSILQDKEGVMWFGTGSWYPDGGVSRYDGKSWITYTHKDGLASNGVLSILQDREDVMWFGTWGGGVSRFDGKSWITYTQKDGLAHNEVRTIIQDKEGVMWFGTMGGVSRFDGKNWQTYTQQDGLADNKVISMLQDKEGIIWFGTMGGVNRFDGKNWQTYTQEDGLAHNLVWPILQDRDGAIWFGTSSGGISLFDGRCFQTIDSKDGLADDAVHSLYMDKSGQVWAGTTGGVVRFMPKNKIQPPVTITQVLAGEKTYTQLSERLNFCAGVRRVAFGFHAPSFKTRPGRMKYFYQLVGRDTDPDSRDGFAHWQGPTNQDTVEYFNLKPEKYTFRVQAVDRDLNYSEIASLELILPPVWHQIVWIRGILAVIGLVFLAAFGFVTWRWTAHRRQVLAYQRLAVQELQDAHDMQMGLMPKTAPPIEGVEVAGRCLSANTVSGDFFDYLAGKRDNEIALVIADVTGKAMKGAMNAVMADGILHAKAEEMEQLSPALLMMKLNNVLKTRMEQEMNVTMVIAVIHRNRCVARNEAISEAISKNHVLERSEGSVSEGEHSVSEWETTLTLANAAHHAHPLLLRDGEIQTLKTGGLPLGMRAGIKYSEEQFKLQSGDVLILMTDGIIEAQNSETQLYSDSGRLERTISQFAEDLSAEALVNAIINDAINFGGDKTTRGDDMTVVVAKIQ